MYYIPGLLPILLRRLRYRLYRLFHRPIRWHSVIDYGADPSGRLDSTHAIQNALDTVGHVTFPVGKFSTSDVHKLLRSNTSIMGYSREHTVIQMKPDTTVDHSQPPPSWVCAHSNGFMSKPPFLYNSRS